MICTLETIKSPLSGGTSGKNTSSGGIISQVTFNPDYWATLTKKEKEYIFLTARTKFRDLISIAQNINNGMSFRDAVIAVIKH